MKQKKSKDKGDPGLVDVTFEFCDPNEKYFHSVSNLLQGFIPGSSLQTSQLADLIISQASVGTLICSEEDHVFAFLSVLNFCFRKDCPAMNEVSNCIIQKSPVTNRQNMELLLANPTTGLIISRRMVNLPPQLALPLHQALVDDMEWAKENEITEEHRNQFRLENLVFISPCEVVDEVVYYNHFDDEVFAREADFCFLSNPRQKGKQNSATGASLMKNEPSENYAIFVISMSKYLACLPELERLTGGM